MEPQSSQTIPRVKKCPFLNTWAWKFASCHFCDVVSIKEILEPAKIQGEGPWISHAISWWQECQKMYDKRYSPFCSVDHSRPQITYIPLTCKIHSLSSQIPKCIIPLTALGSGQVTGSHYLHHNLFPYLPFPLV